MGGTSLTGSKAVGKGMMKKVRKTANNLGLKGRKRKVWMKRITRNIAWAQKNAKFIKGKKAGRSAGDAMLHHIAPHLGTKGKGRTGSTVRSNVLNAKGRKAAKEGNLSLFTGASGKRPEWAGRGASGARHRKQQIPD